MIRSKKWKYKTKMDTGRLWDDHFGHLGYQPKFYRVQGAIFTNSLNYGNHFWPIFPKHIKKRVFSKKSPPKKKKKAPARNAPGLDQSVYPPTSPYFYKNTKKILKMTIITIIPIISSCLKLKSALMGVRVCFHQNPKTGIRKSWMPDFPNQNPDCDFQS